MCSSPLIGYLLFSRPFHQASRSSRSRRPAIGLRLFSPWSQSCAKPSTLFDRANSCGWVSNYPVNATVLASRRLQSKRRAARPARYRERSAD